MDNATHLLYKEVVVGPLNPQTNPQSLQTPETLSPHYLKRDNFNSGFFD
jgi:hypothetical protein